MLLGTDLIKLARFTALANQAFVARTFTQREVEQSNGRSESLAGRWAAKEAVMKALGVGIAEVALTDIEILTEASGKPAVHLAGAAAQMAADTTWTVSISHDGDYALAVVVGVSSP